MNDKEYINKCSEKVYNINRKFFGFDIKYKIKLFYSRKDFDKKLETKTPKWVCASTHKNMILIFAPSIFEKLTSHKLNEYFGTIIHEMNHLFYQSITTTYKPFWLSEGLAMNMDKLNYKYKGHPKINSLYYSYNETNFFKNSKEFYRSSYLMTKNLLKLLGKRKLLFLLKKYSKNPTKKNYLKLFQKYL